MEGSSPLLLCGGNQLVTPHLFLEPRADTGTDGRHQPCPARCGWGCSWHCPVLIVSDQEMFVGKGELLLLQDIKDQITPKGTGATLLERSNHSGRAWPAQVPHLKADPSPSSPALLASTLQVARCHAHFSIHHHKEQNGPARSQTKGKWAKTAGCYLKSILSPLPFLLGMSSILSLLKKYTAKSRLSLR